MLDIFDGPHVRSDLDTLSAEIEALDDVKLEKLSALVAADNAVREAEDRLALARKSVREKQAVYHEAMVVHDRYHKPLTQQQLIADALASQRGVVKPSTEANIKALAATVAKLEKAAKSDRADADIAEKLKAARAELAIAELPARVLDANNALAAAQSEVTKAWRALKDAEPPRGEAIVGWLEVNRDDVTTHLDLVRGAARATAEQARAAKLKNPEPAGPKVWPLEKNLKARGAQRSPRTYFGPR
jgi:chromosome segregation ATPase